MQNDSDNNRPDKCFAQLRCVLKRSNIDSYVQAEEILRIMENQSDTNDQDIDQSQSKTIQMKKGKTTTENMAIVPNYLDSMLSVFQL